jgi:hypothetical protein
MDAYKGYSSDFDCPAIYEIIVRGQIEPDCIYGLEDMTLSYQPQEDGSVHTILTGLLEDQAALNGVLNVIRLLQLTIVSVLKVGDCL